jgi:hypothetical protein
LQAAIRITPKAAINIGVAQIQVLSLIKGGEPLGGPDMQREEI